MGLVYFVSGSENVSQDLFFFFSFHSDLDKVFVSKRKIKTLSLIGSLTNIKPLTLFCHV